MTYLWSWEKQSPSYGNYGNANQWTVNAGLTSLARESCQNSADARTEDGAELVYTFISLTGDARRRFEEAIGWNELLHPHLLAMVGGAKAAVAAGQISSGLDLLAKSDELLLLRIDDYGCRGLTGPEFPDAMTSEDEYGNLIKLCRLDLWSGKDKAAGGSFGLGKAVYWRFSAIQTVLFNSVLAPEDALQGQVGNRILGVNQGTAHRLNDAIYQGRGYFGAWSEEVGAVRSDWADASVADALCLKRKDDRPGTSALILAFNDPDNPSQPETREARLQRLTKELRDGIEESFWPLITRGRMQVRIEQILDGDLVKSETIDPSGTYPELVNALRRFDSGDVNDELVEPLDVVVRDVTIDVSRRKSDPSHAGFSHPAKLVVTLSDEVKDGLEDRVCLFRRAEMVVQTIDRPYEGRRYHAFVLAGAAIKPGAASEDDLRADDFLRFAEPPAHDRWIPTSGRSQASQVNLNAHYLPPWLPNLRAIEHRVVKELDQLFGAIPSTDTSGPESVLRRLRFLRAGPAGGKGAGAAPRKPLVELVDWRVEHGRWHVAVEIQAKNRPEGWNLSPALVVVGLDGSRTAVQWEGPLESVEGCSVSGSTVTIPASDRGRKVKARFRGVSTADLPIPADLTAIDIVAIPASLATAEARS
ncbi:hypothetical protein ACFFGH_28430 [Lysobacter korlensis]|uniref:Uncharacterized protein n=1 Tax=Lysobacter korlensis TaxID=553636 RepID=A0ABV6RZ83_9GAMM